MNTHVHQQYGAKFGSKTKSQPHGDSIQISKSLLKFSIFFLLLVELLRTFSIPSLSIYLKGWLGFPKD